MNLSHIKMQYLFAISSNRYWEILQNEMKSHKSRTYWNTSANHHEADNEKEDYDYQDSDRSDDWLLNFRNDDSYFQKENSFILSNHFSLECSVISDFEDFTQYHLHISLWLEWSSCNQSFQSHSNCFHCFCFKRIFQRWWVIFNCVDNEFDHAAANHELESKHSDHREFHVDYEHYLNLYFKTIVSVCCATKSCQNSTSS